MTTPRQDARIISGWGRYPKVKSKRIRPEKYADLIPQASKIIARGQGRSYGDASLNQDETVILTERLNRFLAFDKEKGIITVEAGITLADILTVITPGGWFLPVTPGTQHASLGGCIAVDAHGKNHHHDGSLGNYVLAMELITADASTLQLTPHNQYADYFWATIGGMGLTGIIGTVTLQLKPLPSDYMRVSHFKASDLDKIFFYLSDATYDDKYTVAWIDCLARGKSLGRSISMHAHHADIHEIPDALKQKKYQPKQKNLFFDLPDFILNRHTVKLFNDYYYYREGKKTTPFLKHYQAYFYPLDTVGHWNRLYGKKGFVQYQCALPTKTAFSGIQKLLEVLGTHGSASFLAVLKRLGNESKGYLSFPLEGFTLALDIPFRESKTLYLLQTLDDIVLSHEGRVYLAKDACLTAETFRRMYTRYPDFLAIKKILDPQNHFSSMLSRRLKIGE